MQFGIAILLMLATGPSTGVGGAAASRSSREAWPGRIACFRLKAPEGGHDVKQGSDLCYGRIEQREGLWLICDRNGGSSAGKIFRISPATLARAVHLDTIVADECLVVTPPAEGWEAFASAHSQVPGEVLDDLHDRVEAGLAGVDGPRLDLEAITIAPSTMTPDEWHLFVSAEEPYSTVLELAVVGSAPQAVAQLISVYVYPEAEEEHGSDRNDGLEGLAWSGRPGLFYWAEEGTRYHGGHPGPRLFFRDPRVGRGSLDEGRLEVEREISDRLTTSVWDLRRGAEQTLNALALAPDGHLLAVDRNGGWILRLDPASGTAARWLDLYDIHGVDLRKMLDDFPAPRRMPYISIEGIAIDPQGDIWLLDDPALPELFRASCLIRLRGLRFDTRPSTGPATGSSPLD